MAREIKDEDNTYFNTGEELNRPSKVLSNVSRVLSIWGPESKAFQSFVEIY